MATINKSNTLMSKKDYWRTSPELIRDALKLLNVTRFNTDVCCANVEVKIEQAIFFISEDMDALQRDWFAGHLTTSFCNPPFSLKYQFFQKAVEQVNKCRENVSKANCIVYRPDGRYQFLLPDGTRPKNSCSFETCLILIVLFKLGCVTVDYKRGLDE